ncbi:MAG TPA: FAD-binding oxidoreductase [Thermomicrobiales bacterium]|nr:FAD-binding oxidoreductase [Thermomicrobiales bacterium]
MTMPSDDLRDEALRSYWHSTAELIVPDDPMPAEAPVVVIGGGLLGCWTAYWLARSGLSVTLLERTAIGWGATGRNGGFLGSGTALGYGDAIERYGHDHARTLWQLTLDGQALAKQVIAEEEIDCDHRAPGIISLALGEDRLAEQTVDIAAMNADGFAGDMIDRATIQSVIATPLADDIAGGAYFSRDGGQLHSLRYLGGLARAARRHGARLCRAGVTALTPSGDGTDVETDAGTIRAGRVVVCLNAWSDTLVPELAGLVVPVRGQILCYKPIAPVFSTGLAASVTPTGEYWQQTPDGTIVIGGCRASAPGGDVGVREIIPTPDVTAAIESVLPRLFPELASQLTVQRRWAGPMAFTSDYLPVADAAPGLPGVWATGGFCGHGMPYGPRVGQLLAEAAATGQTPDALVPLALTRPTLAPLAVTA